MACLVKWCRRPTEAGHSRCQKCRGVHARGAKQRYARSARVRAHTRAYYAIWRHTLSGKFSKYKEGAKKRGLVFALSLVQFDRLTLKACVWCGIPAAPRHGLDRIDNTKGYLVDNVHSCCTECNYARLDSSFEAFDAWLDRVMQFRARA